MEGQKRLDVEIWEGPTPNKESFLEKKRALYGLLV